ncbi:MAG: phosphate ABC transporter permease subunit PstC [Chthoniobacterales bacterium]|nr:MAG: phosphate ABC transporter permease subunit PstC [Chthoniobacterales bacterium]
MEGVADPRILIPARSTSRRTQVVVEQGIKAFFGGNALVAVVVLALITIFLFREGFGFFGQNLANLRLYRQAGLEYVDIIRGVSMEHESLSRKLSEIRLREVRTMEKRNVPLEEINAKLAPFDQFASSFSDTAETLHSLVSDLTEKASALKEKLFAQAELLAQRSQLERAGAQAEAARIVVPEVDRTAALASLHQGAATYESVSADMTAKLYSLFAAAPPLPDPAAQKNFEQWKTRTREYLAALPAASEKLRTWSSEAEIPWYRSLSSFLFGREWITASFWQDWYGIIPLLVGSIMVSIVALVIAVPLGVSSAIYVSEIASRHEKRLIKPYIEFISAIPSVVLGFFGIAVVGQAVRAASQSHFFKWVSFFPISERLNIFTAGCLLALMAVPTIFTLSEDALRNVPRGFKEASYALGANRLQTIGRVLVPASLSGIVSAILLGLGRVIGETMVVLLCAGNRIAIPDFTQGLGAIFQPVHTMTGIIAQEMGEVVRGSTHYRALFMVGLVLFTITLGINYLAQKLVTRFRMSIG